MKNQSRVGQFLRHECIQSSHPFMVYIYPTHHLCVGPGPSEACMGWGCNERSHEHGIIAMSKNRDETLQIGICTYLWTSSEWTHVLTCYWTRRAHSSFTMCFFHFLERPLEQQSLQCTISEAIFCTSNLDIQDAQLGGDHTYGGSHVYSFFHLSIADRCLSSRGSVASGLKAGTIDSNDIGAGFIPIYLNLLLVVSLFFASTKLNRLNPNISKLWFVKCLYHHLSIC